MSVEASYWVLGDEKMVESVSEEWAQRTGRQSIKLKHGSQRNLEIEGSQTWLPGSLEASDKEEQDAWRSLMEEQEPWQLPMEELVMWWPVAENLLIWRPEEQNIVTGSEPCYEAAFSTELCAREAGCGEPFTWEAGCREPCNDLVFPARHSKRQQTSQIFLQKNSKLSYVDACR